MIAQSPPSTTTGRVFRVGRRPNAVEGDAEKRGMHGRYSPPISVLGLDARPPDRFATSQERLDYLPGER
jgi:hypothetical protein